MINNNNIKNRLPRPSQATGKTRWALEIKNKKYS